MYLLNAKRADLHEIEQLYGVTVQVIPEGEDEGAKMRVASAGPRPTSMPKFEPIVHDEPEDDEELDAYEDEDEEEEEREERARNDDDQQWQAPPAAVAGAGAIADDERDERPRRGRLQRRRP